MSRPEHLSCPNTAEGIMRINGEQELYDRDPEQYERQEMEEQEQAQEQEQEQMQAEWEASQEI